MTAALQLLPPPLALAAARLSAFESPPETARPTFTAYELWDILRGGEGEGTADDLERGLAKAARIHGPLELAIGEGLVALRVGDRLAELGYHLDDYAREVLDLQPRTALNLVHMARELRTRPLLREALRRGEVRLRAAQTVLPVAHGEAEAFWVALASRETVRALEARVRVARSGAADGDEEWGRFGIECGPEERAIIDDALEVAGRELPGSKRFERLEAMAQEFLGAVPGLVEGSARSEPVEGRAGSHDSAQPEPTDCADTGRLEGRFRSSQRGDLESRKAQLEMETDRWAALPRILDWQAPDLRFDELTSASEVDAALRELARCRRAWDQLVGHLALMLEQARVYQVLGFASFRHYVDERLGLAPTAVQQRAALEKRIWQSPALGEARRQRLSYEKLRALSFLPEKEIGPWIPRARVMTVVALRKALEAEEERQMRARCRLVAPMPRRIAALLAAALDAARALAGAPISDGKCLAIVAQHFLDVWGQPARPTRPRTSSQRVRARDAWLCQVPGCSHAATHSHHVHYRSHGGHRTDPANQLGVCSFHHLRCIHGGFLRVWGTAPDGLTWLRNGVVWTGV